MRFVFRFLCEKNQMKIFTSFSVLFYYYLTSCPKEDAPKCSSYHGHCLIGFCTQSKKAIEAIELYPCVRKSSKLMIPFGRSVNSLLLYRRWCVLLLFDLNKVPIIQAWLLEPLYSFILQTML